MEKQRIKNKTILKKKSMEGDLFYQISNLLISYKELNRYNGPRMDK